MFKLEKSQLESISRVCKTASTRHANQGFECVLIEVSGSSVRFTGGDGIVQIQSTIDADVETEFTAAVNAQKFMQAVNACGDATVILKDQLIVKAGRRQFKLHTVSPESYPAYPEAVDDQKVDIDPQSLIESIKRVSFASAKNDVRHMLNGVYIGRHAVATDGHRMCVVDLGVEGSAIVSIDAVNKVPIDIDGQVYLSNNVLSIVSDRESFKCKLIDGRYVAYEKAIPQHDKFEHRVDVNRLDFIDAIKAAQINAPDSGAVLFSFSDESEIKSRSGKSEDALVGFECVSSDDFEMGFNSSYLLDALKVLSSDLVTINFTGQQLHIDSDGMINVISMCRV